MTDRRRPPHKRCSCTACESWFSRLIEPGCLALARPVRFRSENGFGPNESLTVTWDPSARHFVWLEKIPLGQPVVVMNRLSEKQPGGHLDAVFFVWMKDGSPVVLATSRKWLMPCDTAEEDM